LHERNTGISQVQRLGAPSSILIVIKLINDFKKQC